ncbi:nuclear transport factor 2 family protein [Paraglaciecola sp. MB-3u-78]|jgi:hypothetical protein|uniref:nuclear transport factor 2 family protein n=1 Tax=Paraglaciecola sp. MB-3u-78 TaxID=2058332 RepID=UPI000C337DE7|nr:nuclear transport factor 2 family protein [Paraglaciecola sp. MB-3u-78]PKH00062.1 hypothetical protein CXF95_05335 [Paraglaciecola sp. MB-3u-78]
MQRYLAGLLLIICSLTVMSFAQDHKIQTTTENQAISQLMDGLHYAASQADLDGYLGSFTPTGVFMGTDDWERWTRPITLDEYVKERFKEGTGWTYTSVERHINFADDGQTAWLDEIIVSKKWGRFRGTGVVTKQNNTWKIAHYSMSVLVANEAFVDISKINQKAFEARKSN